MTKQEEVMLEIEKAINEADSTAAFALILTHTLRDALALLKEQEARVIELSEISPNIYVWLEDRDDGTVFPLKGGVIDPDGDDWFRFDADFGEDFVYYPTGPFGKHWRVWDKCPTPEQMRDTPWEGDSDAE